MIELSGEDTVIGNITWWKKRTGLEKKLIIGVVFVASVTLSFLLDASLYSSKTSEMCKSVECITASSELLTLIDETVDPCNDFFKFVCGKMSARTHSKDIPTESINIQIKKQLTMIMSEPLNKNDSPALNYEKQLFSACVNETKNGTSVEVFKSMMTDLGGWPVLIGEEWSGKNYRWMDIIEKIKNMGLNYKIFLQISLNEDTSEKLNTNFSIKVDKLFPFTNKKVHLYKKLLIEYAIALGGNEANAIEEINQMFEFIDKLNKLNSFNKNETVRLKISDLQRNFQDIDWLKYFKLLLEPPNEITDNDYVVLPHSNFPTYFINLINFTTERTLTNYILWSATRNIWPIVSNELLQLYNQLNCLRNYGETDLIGVCQEAITHVMSPIPSYLAYAKRFATKSTRDAVKEMYYLVLKEFKKLIKLSDWIDSDSKIKAMKWLESMVPVFGITAKTIDNIYTKVYKPINTNDTFLKIYLKLKKERDLQMLIEKKPKNEIQTDITHSDIPKTYILFLKEKNLILIPVGMLQGMYFDKNRPMYMNYGLLGKSLAATLVSTYTYSASDEFHSYNISWSEETKKSYVDKINCISHTFQYFNDEINYDMSEKFFIKQRKLAEINGIKLAYNAYRNWVNKNGEELSLVGLNYTNNQIFWMSLFADACFEEDYNTWDNFYSDNEVVRQSFDFAMDFDCHLDSKMNPSNKCVVSYKKFLFN